MYDTEVDPREDEEFVSEAWNRLVVQFLYFFSFFFGFTFQDVKIHVLPLSDVFVTDDYENL